MNKLIEIKTIDYLTIDEKREAWKLSKKLFKIMLDRQKEFSNENKQENITNRRIKIYIGILSEIIFEKYYKEIFENLNLKFIKNGIDNFENYKNEFDFKIENIEIDIKSSKEKSITILSNEDILNKRNFN